MVRVYITWYLVDKILSFKGSVSDPDVDPDPDPHESAVGSRSLGLGGHKRPTKIGKVQKFRVYVLDVLL